jgi:hypothetical protein
MPKLSRNSLCEYNKSCSAQLKESSKIELAFFRIFYDFLEILQVSVICIHYWRCCFASRTLQRTKTSQLCPWFTKKNYKEVELAMWPVAMRGGGVGRIQASRPRSRPGRQWGTTTCSPRARGRPRFERRRLRRGRAVTAGGGGRGGSGDGKARSLTGQRVSAWALARPKEGEKVVGWLGALVEVAMTAAGSVLTRGEALRLL